MDAYLQIDTIPIPKNIYFSPKGSHRIQVERTVFLFGLGAFFHGNTSSPCCILNLLGGLTVGSLLRLLFDNLREIILKE